MLVIKISGFDGVGKLRREDSRQMSQIIIDIIGVEEILSSVGIFYQTGEYYTVVKILEFENDGSVFIFVRVTCRRPVAYLFA